MASMTDIQKKNDKELFSLVDETREAIRRERFVVAGSKGRDVKKVRENRKDIARALTAMSARRNA
ncbi:MAG: 50S ribosomal protein L29 [Patescibacteria group bacterium]